MEDSRIFEDLRHRYEPLARVESVDALEDNGVHEDIRINPRVNADGVIRVLRTGEGLFLYLRGVGEPLWEGVMSERSDLYATIDRIAALGVVWTGWPFRSLRLFETPEVRAWDGLEAISRFDPPWKLD